MHTLSSTCYRGAFGVVNEGVRISTGQLVAIKRLPKVRSHPEFLVNELAVLEAIGQHDYIVDYVDHFEDAESLTIVFELCVVAAKSLVQYPVHLAHFTLTLHPPPSHLLCLQYGRWRAV